MKIYSDHMISINNKTVSRIRISGASLLGQEKTWTCSIDACHIYQVEFTKYERDTS